MSGQRHGFALVLVDVLFCLLLSLSPGSSIGSATVELLGTQNDERVNQDTSLVIQMTGDGSLFHKDDEVTVIDIKGLVKETHTALILTHPPISEHWEISAQQYLQIFNGLHIDAINQNLRFAYPRIQPKGE